MVTPKNEVAAANRRSAALIAKTPTAVAARYDRRRGRVAIDPGCTSRNSMLIFTYPRIQMANSL
jgi:hypothetical protein